MPSSTSLGRRARARRRRALPGVRRLRPPCPWSPARATARTGRDRRRSAGGSAGSESADAARAQPLLSPPAAGSAGRSPRVVAAASMALPDVIDPKRTNPQTAQGYIPGDGRHRFPGHRRPVRLQPRPPPARALAAGPPPARRAERREPDPAVRGGRRGARARAARRASASRRSSWTRSSAPSTAAATSIAASGPRRGDCGRAGSGSPRRSAAGRRCRRSTSTGSARCTS